MSLQALVPEQDLWIDAAGGALTGVLRHGHQAVLVNAPTPGLGARLQAAGITAVVRVLFTDHRRELADALPELRQDRPPELTAPEAERALFEDPAAYWANPATRWRLLCGQVPYHATHTQPLPLAGTVRDGDTWRWHDLEVRVIATPGASSGSVSYLVRGGAAGAWTAFTGDLIWGPGQVRDLYSLQRGVTRGGHRVGDYHGFMGAMWTVLASLERVLEATPARLVPAHGQVIERPPEAVEQLRSRFQAAYRNYVSISALRWYFPAYFAEDGAGGDDLPCQETMPLPPAVRILSGTTWMLLSADRHALLIDPYSPAAVEAAAKALAEGDVVGFDGIWLTHYHDDHVEAAASARDRFGIPVMADQVMAEVIAQPGRFLLTCLAPTPTPVDRPTRDGETWRWRDLRLTAYHFPGQSLYHGGLHAVPDRGPSLFFAGDAVTPTGIDDYCTWNRNWLGPDRGYERCLRLLEALAPDYVFNQHVRVGFRFSAAAYARMRETLAQREALYRALLPWEHADFGTDEAWLHTDPYEQALPPGGAARVALRAFNHAAGFRRIRVRPILPPGWLADPAELEADGEPGREVSLDFVLRPPATATGRVAVPFAVTVAGVHLGSCREAVFRLG